MTTLGAGPAAADTFTGCLTENGKLRNVAQGDEPRRPCRGKSTEITWNVEGPKGDPGPQGPSGPTGDTSDILEQLDNVLAIATGRGKFVFVTSTKQTGDLGGIDGADDICNDRAADAGLPGVYKAWLASTDANDPESTFVRATGPYVRTDYARVADDWADLTDGRLPRPINIDEFGELQSGNVWTDVSADGKKTGVIGGFFPRHCNHWSDGTGGQFGRFAHMDDANSNRTLFALKRCSNLYALYFLSNDFGGKPCCQRGSWRVSAAAARTLQTGRSHGPLPAPAHKAGWHVRRNSRRFS